MAIGNLRCLRVLRIELSTLKEAWLLPAEAGEFAFQPSREVTLLEIAIP
jgi:hypothetical protein